MCVLKKFYKKRFKKYKCQKLSHLKRAKSHNQRNKKEKLLIYLLINYPEQSYNKIRELINIEDIKNTINQSIIKKLYEELEKGNSNTNNVLDWFEEQEIINEISWILAYDFEIVEVNKCIEDILKIYTKEKFIIQRNEIIKQLEREDLTR